MTRLRPGVARWLWVAGLAFAGCRSAAVDGDRERASTEFSAQSAGGVDNPGQDQPGAEAEPSDATDSPLVELLISMGVRYLPSSSRIEVDGWVNMREGLVEVFACAPEGKTHETVVVLDCVPSAIHAGLLALGLEPGRPVEVGTDDGYRAPTGDGVLVRVRWTDSEGAQREARAEDWVWNAPAERSMSHAPWIFAGSFQQPVSGTPGETSYAANYVKSLVTTYHDASSILETPRREGVDDTVYYANARAVPPVGTPVVVSFEAAR